MNQPNARKSDWTIVKMLEWATEYFKNRHVHSPRLSIEWLLAHVLQVKRLDLYLQFDRPLTHNELNQLKPLIQRRGSHEPLQYITGTTDFYKLTLRVTPDVLIPRPETEQLVEKILMDHPENKPLSFLDIGTGSGCIALAVKKECPNWNVTAIDNSDKALCVARRNAVESGLEVIFILEEYESHYSDKKWDIIVSNPPYITKSEWKGLSRQIVDYEPVDALIADDIDKVYSELMKLCTHHLSPAGTFYWEINESYGDKLLKICNIAPFKSELHQDYSGKDRFIIGCFE